LKVYEDGSLTQHQKYRLACESLPIQKEMELV
jgi:hypothetical protein